MTKSFGKVMGSFFDNMIDICISRFWWVFLFLLIVFVGYTHAIKKKEKLVYEIQSRIESLQKEKEYLTVQKEELNLKLNSQSDPAWIEQVLMKEVGLVPEGQIKIHFTKQE